MEDPIEKAVRRAIATMHDRLAETLTIDDMARAALFSKYHFARVFHRTTGVSPGRFLSAIRLQRAKRLLISTDMYVADISARVGYSSVGTFSSRFAGSVGLSPTAFRRLGGWATRILTGPVRAAPGTGGIVHGDLLTPAARPGVVFAGLFRDRMPAGRPVRCTVLERPGPFLLDGVPDGAWYLLAHFVGADGLAEAASRLFDGDGLAVGSYGPIVVRGGGVHRADLCLRPVTALDPPVLLALLDVRRTALELVAARAA